MNATPIKITSGKDKIEFDSIFDGNKDPFIIVPYGPEGVGKTRFGLSGPSGVGVVSFEMKTYKTLQLMATERGPDFQIFKPKDPSLFLVNSRKVDMMQDADQKTFYKNLYQRGIDTAYSLLEHKDVRLLMIDKFSTFCRFVEFGVNGLNGKKKKIGEKVFIDKSESNQEIADFMNSLSQYKKPVVLVMEHRDEYVNDKQTGRVIPGGFKYIGSHSNLMVQMESNPQWNPDKTGKQYEWHFALSVNKCQLNSELEGPQGHRILMDEMVSLSNLMAVVDPDYESSEWE